MMEILVAIYLIATFIFFLIYLGRIVIQALRFGVIRNRYGAISYKENSVYFFYIFICSIFFIILSGVGAGAGIYYLISKIFT
jgi:hypothetical protein